MRESPNPTTRLSALLDIARQPIDGASLAVFRFAVGIMVAYEATVMGRYYFSPNDGLAFHFPYDGFGWVPAGGAYASLMDEAWFVSGVLMALGLFYRPAAILALVLTTFGFLQAQELYLNHFYLLIIVLFLLVLTPAHQAFSLDRLLFPGPMAKVALARVHLWLLKGQVEIVLVYAGLVKLNSDWLHLEPLRSWLHQSQDRIFFGHLFGEDWAVSIAAYGVIALHLIGAPLLLWKPARLAVFVVYFAFHLINHNVFDIGIFPFLTIACTTLFFEPDWPRALAGRFKLPFLAPAGSGDLIAPQPRLAGAALTGFAAVWLATQALIPLRHNLYPGDVAWTYEGHMFSWRMKLVDRWSPGLVALAYLPERKLIVRPALNAMMTADQYDTVSTQPRMAYALAPQLADLLRQKYGVRDVQIHYYDPAGYDNREAILLIDPVVDMLKASAAVSPPTWVNIVNDKPLRRIEEFSAKYDYPVIADMAEEMGLPGHLSCEPKELGWLECDASPRRQQVSQQ